MPTDIVKRRVQTGALIPGRPRPPYPPDLKSGRSIEDEELATLLQPFPGPQSLLFNENSIPFVPASADEELARLARPPQQGALIEKNDSILPFPNFSFRPGQRVVLTIRPTTIFKATRLVIFSEDAPHFDVNDIKVGIRSQFQSDTPIPAAIFSEKVNGVSLEIETCRNATISIDLTNRDAHVRWFNAVVYGHNLG